MAMISLKDVSKVYQEGARPALSHINLEIDNGEFVFLVGASGSGKTTLLQLLLREQQATSGQIHVIGEDLRRLPDRLVPRYRRNIGFVFQDYKLLAGKTVWQNIAFALEVIGARRSVIKTRVAQVLTTVGLDGKENRLPSELSGGEAQRVAIARAYVNHPKLLLADEPTGNLDPTTSVGIMEVLDAINRTGDTTVVMATHNEEIVNSMKKRVVELHNGVMVRDEKNGGYDSAKYFPDAEVESKARRVNAAGSPLEGLRDGSAPDGGARKRRTKDQGLSGSPARGHTDGAQGTDGSAEPGHRAAGAEPPVPHGMRHSRGAGRGNAGPDRSATGNRAVRDASRAATQSDDDLIEAAGGDPGIARLEKSIHSGRTGRYEESFRPVEETLTWGTGLTAAEIAGHGAVDGDDAHAGNTSRGADNDDGEESRDRDDRHGRDGRVRDVSKDTARRTGTTDRGGAR